MNYIFDVDTLQEVPNLQPEAGTHYNGEPPPKPTVAEPHHYNTMVQIKHITKKNIIGTNARSKNGCASCKKDRKKCDERFPRCGKCIDKNRECLYLLPKNGRKRKANNSKDEQKLLVQLGEISGLVSVPVTETNCNIAPITPAKADSLESSPVFSKCNTLSTVPSSTKFLSPVAISPGTGDFGYDVYDHLENFTNTHPGFTVEQKDGCPLFLENSQQTFSLSLLSPSSNLSLFLDEKGLKYLQYFQSNVSKLLCLVSDGSRNYFVDTYLSLAEYDEAILNALAAWGGYFMESLAPTSTNDNLFLRYMEKARTIISLRYHTNCTLNKDDRYTLLCFYMIEMGLEICTGDVSNWYKIFSKAHEMLTTNYGGIIQLCSDFSYSNEVKWLALNLQYHDIMSSVTQSKGTLFSLNDYETLFTHNKILDSDEYGLDPFQGIIQPIYLILGEIMNAHVTLKRCRSKIEKELESIDEVAKSTFQSRYFRQMRIFYFKDAEATYDKLRAKVNACEPSSIQISCLSRAGKTTLQHHLTLFEIVRNTCKLYMLLHLKQVTPASPEVQLILLETLEHIESIADTSIVAALPMLLLICGISCSLPCDRQEMRITFNKIYSRYRVGNLARAWDVVEEYWKRNKVGTLSIDWVNICEENDWDLCMC